MIFFNDSHPGADMMYLAMGRNDRVGYDSCTAGTMLYASRFHGEIFEFDSFWERLTGQEVVKIALELPQLVDLGAEQVIFKSEQVPDDTYLRMLSYWRIRWDTLEAELIAISEAAD